MLGDFSRSKRDFSGTQQVHRAADSVSDPAGDEALVVVQFLLVLVAAGAQGRAGGMGVGRTDHDVREWNARFGLDQFASLIADAAVHSEQIADHQGQFLFAIIEDQAASMQFVVNVGRREGFKTSDHTAAQGWGDVAGGGPGFQGAGLGSVGCGTESPDTTCDQYEHDSHSSHPMQEKPVEIGDETSTAGDRGGGGNLSQLRNGSRAEGDTLGELVRLRTISSITR